MGRSGAVDVVLATALGVLEGLVRLFDEPEEQRVPTPVRVMRLDESAEGGLDLVSRRLAGDGEDLVVVEIGHWARCAVELQGTIVPRAELAASSQHWSKRSCHSSRKVRLDADQA